MKKRQTTTVSERHKLMTDPIEVAVNVSLNVESVEVKTDEKKNEYPKTKVFGYSPGDKVTLGGKNHTISTINYTKEFESEPAKISFMTENGLNIGGSISDVIPLLND
jgi:hypothetical protein